MSDDYAKLFKRAHHIQHKVAHLAVNLTEYGTSISQKQLNKIIDKMIDLASLHLERPDDQAYHECLSVLNSVYEQYNQAEDPAEIQYWQGKKDGMRTVLMLLANSERQAKAWEALQATSEGL